MKANPADIKKLASLIYKGKAKEFLTTGEFKQICNGIFDLSDFVNSPIFPFLIFDERKGFDFIESPDGNNLFFHLYFKSNNLKSGQLDINVITYGNGYGRIHCDFSYGLTTRGRYSIGSWNQMYEKILSDLLDA